MYFLFITLDVDTSEIQLHFMYIKNSKKKLYFFNYLDSYWPPQFVHVNEKFFSFPLCIILQLNQW